VPVVGSTVGGKYRIDRAIGAGGMGTVVAATHIGLGSPVALKFLNEKIRDSSNSLQRFTREARASAQLRSEHVCRVSDFGIEDGVPYIAMELLEGNDLAYVLDAGPVGVDRAVDYIQQACVGLAEAHGLGIVHRDLKPGNLFLAKRADGSPLLKVLDFGVAKIPVDGEHALTQTATVIGSPGYMAPEQLRSSKTVDARADVWALGVILYELISARHPFHASAVTEVAVKIAMDEPPPLVEAPPPLREIVMRCLAKDPAQRYSDVGALAAALAPFAPGGGELASIAHRFLNDGVENRRTQPRPVVTDSPATKDERAQLPTMRETPRPRLESPRIQPAPEPARSRLPLVLGILAVLAAGGAVLAVVMTRDPTEPAPPVVAPAPAPVAPADAGPGRGTLDIRVEGAPVATIIVDGVEWGVGQRISREVEVGSHEVEIRADGSPPVKQKVTAPNAVAILIKPLKPPSYPKKTDDDPLSGVRPLQNLAAAANAVNGTLKRAASRMQAKGLLSEDVPNGRQQSEQIKTAIKMGNIQLAQGLADQMLLLIDAIQIDKAFIGAKIARMNERIARIRTGGDLRKQLDDVMRDVVQNYNDGAFVPANIKLGVIAGLVARAGPADLAGGKTPATPPRSPQPDEPM
jgi:eukaryotic-like serine/threonine-protein kinase